MLYFDLCRRHGEFSSPPRAIHFGVVSIREWNPIPICFLFSSISILMALLFFFLPQFLAARRSHRASQETPWLPPGLLRAEAEEGGSGSAQKIRICSKGKAFNSRFLPQTLTFFWFFVLVFNGNRFLSMIFLIYYDFVCIGSWY